MQTEVGGEGIKDRTRPKFTAVVVSTMHALGHINLETLPVLYPLLRDQFSFGYIGIAMLSLVSQIVTGPLQISFGVLTRFARRLHILGIGCLLGFLGTLIIGFSQNFTHLLLGRVIRGMGTSSYHPVGGAVMASGFPAGRAKALAAYQTSGSIGSLIGPLLVGALLHVWGWRNLVLAMGIPFLIAAILCFLAKEGTDQKGGVLPKGKRDRFGLEEYKAVFKDRNSLILALAMMVGAGGRGGSVVKTYLTVLLVDRFHISAAFAAMFLAAYMFGSVFGPLFLGWLSDRGSPLTATRLNLFCAAVFMLLILWPAAPGIMLGAFVFCAGFFVESRGTLLQVLLIDCGSQDARIDTQLSMYFSVGAISGPLWTLLVGLLADRIGVTFALCTMAVSYIVGLVVLGFVRLNSVLPLQEQPPAANAS